MTEASEMGHRGETPLPQAGLPRPLLAWSKPAMEGTPWNTMTGKRKPLKRSQKSFERFGTLPKDLQDERKPSGVEV